MTGGDPAPRRLEDGMSSSPIGAAYGSLARWYDLLADPFERHARSVGLRLLSAQPGERILEVGQGPGHALAEIASDVGPAGRVVSLDASAEMVRLAHRRLRSAGLAARCELLVGDGVQLPFAHSAFDAVFVAFTLEAIGPADATESVLAECRRVLRPGGRLVCVSVADRLDGSLVGRAYRWAHSRFPTLVNCRPIDVAVLATEAGFIVRSHLRLGLWGLPVDAVLATR